ncbi:DUF3530 family protein [Thalassotalea sp. M1531]|uniref:DUF3530 family protein n=1 Tax=Thalassotalea algicola TaxID=2716224 RepID=A0A7Y0Q4S9_9GAMM|nr:DUF3530 family protein [Thalassotalea algicola]NMP30304.1 DUF3530 family protein [Thalassotalea algicola]
MFKKFIYILFSISLTLGSFLGTTVAQQTSTEESENSTTQSQETAPTSDIDSSETPAKTADKITINPPVALIDQFEQDIKNSVDETLVKPMLAGTEDFLTITQPDTHSSDKGVAILLPEWSQPATDVKAINFLRQNLPSQGWTTITLQPIAKPENYPSLAQKHSEAIEENQKTLDEYQNKLAPLMTAVMEKAADYPGIFLVIAQGNNAAVLMNLYQQEKVEKPNAFITLSAHMLTSADNQQLANVMAESEIPVLDVVLKKDLTWITHFAPLRKKLAQKELKPYYRQRTLTNFRTGYYPEQHLAKEIKGWLTTIGW